MKQRLVIVIAALAFVTVVAALTVLPIGDAQAMAGQTFQESPPCTDQPYISYIDWPWYNISQYLIFSVGAYAWDPCGEPLTYRWDFGDGTPAKFGNWVDHMYAADGVYTVTLRVSTADNRFTEATNSVTVRTTDVFIARMSVPKSAAVGQQKSIVVRVASKRYDETVNLILERSIPATPYGSGGFEYIGGYTQLVPMSNKRGTEWIFNYTFSNVDLAAGKVTFRATANTVGWSDAWPAGNSAVGVPPTRVTAGGKSAGTPTSSDEVSFDFEYFDPVRQHYLPFAAR